MDAEKRQELQTRMKRIAGQIGGVQRMVEEDRYCVDILNQISAVRSALDALGIELLSNHLESCVLGHSIRARESKTNEAAGADGGTANGALAFPEMKTTEVDHEETLSCCHPSGHQQHSPNETHAAAAARNPTKKYFCPMCAGVQSDKPGDCPKCRMALERNPTFRAPAIYTCPMHPQIEQGDPGACPICGDGARAQTHHRRA